MCFYIKSICLFTFSQLFVYRYRKGDNDEDIMTEYKSIMASNSIIPNTLQADDSTHLTILNSDTDPEEAPMEKKFQNQGICQKRKSETVLYCHSIIGYGSINWYLQVSRYYVFSSTYLLQFLFFMVPK